MCVCVSVSAAAVNVVVDDVVGDNNAEECIIECWTLIDMTFVLSCPLCIPVVDLYIGASLTHSLLLLQI